MDNATADPDFDPALDCCHREAPAQNHAPGCWNAPKPEECQAHRVSGCGLCMTAARGETAQERVDRIERTINMEEPVDPVSRADVGFLLDCLRLAGSQRVKGIREAAGLIKAAKHRETTTRFLAGKKEQVVRASNSKLMDVVAALIERYADDAEAGKV